MREVDNTVIKLVGVWSLIFDWKDSDEDIWLNFWQIDFRKMVQLIDYPAVIGKIQEIEVEKRAFDKWFQTGDIICRYTYRLDGWNFEPRQGFKWTEISVGNEQTLDVSEVDTGNVLKNGRISVQCVLWIILFLGNFFCPVQGINVPFFDTTVQL